MINELSDEELLRYSRQIMLPAFDAAGQLALANARVLIVGLGGLGSPVALYLAAAGVGQLVLADHDEVDLSNLQRQIVHEQDSIGRNKSESAAERLALVNPHVKVECLSEKLDETSMPSVLQDVDLVLDCSDNFSTRFALNAACVRLKKPLVSGAAIRMEGQLAVFDTRSSDSPCYQCLYSGTGEEDLNCSQSGVMAPLVGIIGAMQALEAIKVLAGVGESLAGYLLVFDAMYADWRKMRLRKDPHCSVCGNSD